MHAKDRKAGYLLAGLLGAMGGVLVVAVATNALPRIMSGMMRNMMRQMGEGGSGPPGM